VRRDNELLISCHRLCPGQDWCWAALTAKGTVDFGSGDWWLADACPAPCSRMGVRPVTGKVQLASGC